MGLTPEGVISVYNAFDGFTDRNGALCREKRYMT